MRTAHRLVLLAAAAVAGGCSHDTLPRQGNAALPTVPPLTQARDTVAFGSAALERLAARADKVEQLHRRGDTLLMVSAGDLSYAPLGEAVWAAGLQQQYPRLFALHRQHEASLSAPTTQLPSYTLRTPQAYIKLVRVPMPAQSTLKDTDWQPARSDTVQIVAARIRDPRLQLRPGLRVGMSRAAFFRALFREPAAPAWEGVRVVRNVDPMGAELVQMFRLEGDTLREIVLRAAAPRVTPGL